ncbi:sigma-70 family RNA polymerase sigma factor [Kitasatospora sp. NPDC089509]|uniref:sigma-70 family RNA polymerase sigma factor n=1 Tax=Kitasatospora sp. NPDC089509 TaxID=3364079 RepID=UPI0037F958FE
MENLAVLDSAPVSAPAQRGATVDEATMAQLQREHGQALLGLLLGLTHGDRQRAEDLVQETLLRAWRHPEALHTDHASMRPWLFTVARRLCIDARRARLARPVEEGGRPLENLATADDEIERSVVVQDVRDALRQLSPEHRAVLLEVYFRGRSVAEASERLGVPEGTVKSRTYYALRSMRRNLRGYGADC